MIINKCKRQIALMLVFVIMLTLVFPIGTFAEDDSNDSEESISEPSRSFLIPVQAKKLP